MRHFDPDLRRADARFATGGGSIPLALALLFLLAAPPSSATQTPRSPPGGPALAEPDTTRLAAFTSWDSADQHAVLAQWRESLFKAAPRTFALVERALGNGFPKPAELPVERPARWFDPKEHAPAQPIPRRLANLDAPDALAIRKRTEVRQPPRPERVGFHYDFGLGKVVRSEDAADPSRMVTNGFLGRHPDWDLADAAIAGAIDDGTQRAVLDAFSHAYTTRAGDVHAGVTLFDAWSSGMQVEMPDVDVLGLVHTLIGDRKKTWIAPIPGDQQPIIYERLGQEFLPARRLRTSTTNLARAYADPAPVLVDGILPTQALAFHAVWATANDDPVAVKQLLLPLDDPAWDMFVGTWLRRMGQEPELLAAARAREAALAGEREHIKEALRAAIDGHTPTEKPNKTARR